MKLEMIKGFEKYTPGYTTNAMQFMAQRTVKEHAAFFRFYLQPGVSLLDCGCGPGSITVGLAELVAPGKVVGVDLEVAQTESAAQTARGRGIHNVQFKAANVYELPFDDYSFDRVFSHALMEHLADPVQALCEMHRVLKPGGWAGICSPDWGGFLITPTNDVVDEAITFYKELQQKNGGDPCVGRRLGSLMEEAGFSKIEMSAHYESYHSRIRIAEYLAQRIEWAAYEPNRFPNGGSSDVELHRLAQALRDWAQQPFGLFAQSWVSVIGRA